MKAIWRDRVRRLAWTLSFCILFVMPVVATNTYSCSNTEERQVVPSNTVISLAKAMTGGNLCTLVRITTSGGYDEERHFTRLNEEEDEQSFSTTMEGEETYFAPVARSYNGYDWERVAGPYRATLSIKCPSEINGESHCDVTVPDALNEYETFYLVHDEYSTGVKEEAARFFEQTTFGTTREYLQNVINSALHGGEEEVANNSNDDPNDSNGLMPFFRNWLHEQMYDVPPTLHRALWRGRATSFMDVPSREGTINHPCRVGAYWRRCSFNRRDKDKILTIKKVAGRYALSVDGNIRTMMDAIDFDENTNKNFDYSQLPADFKICNVRKAETNNK